MALTGDFEGTYTTAREPRTAYRNAAHYDPSGFSARVYTANGEVMGSPTIIWPAALDETGTREQDCRERLEGCIEDQVSVR